jgi:selenocysteine lyase/cysteine desulfurase
LQGEACRAAFAALIDVPKEDVALIPSASVGVGTVAASLTAGDEVVIADDEFNSVMFPVLVAEQARGTRVNQVPFEQLAEAITPKTTLVAFSLVQSQSGHVARQTEIVDAARRVGARVLIDATHAVPFVPVDTHADFVVCAAYKHLLCPRGVGFMKVAPEHRQALPAWLANWRSTPNPYASYYGGPLSQASTAARYDVSLAWHAWAGAAVSLSLLCEWRTSCLLTEPVALADRLAAHIGIPATGSTLVSVAVENPESVRARLAEAGIKAAVRAQNVRLSTHVYTTPGQIDIAARALNG